ncbi:MAG: hypothetical protein DLM68_15690 [Hyphomicrobiales bacterium]|nr:MAG: hypothetical protein DLM68_15690 [Hyphomicrobiales bacterium]
MHYLAEPRPNRVFILLGITSHPLKRGLRRRDGRCKTLIQGFVVAMNCATTEAELISAVFPRPTLSEIMHESVLKAYGHVIHT